MKLADALAVVQERVYADLSVFFELKRRSTVAVDPNLEAVVNQMTRFALRGGKRLRPFLCWLGYTATASSLVALTKLPTLLLATMRGLELFHVFMLIHDDIVDADTTRRGGPTVHVDLADSQDQQLGINLAILAGDLAGAWADEQFVSLNKPEINKLYTRMKEEVLEGQLLDVLAKGGRSIDKAKVDERKTAWYSVIRPLQFGAILARADQSLVDALALVGLPVGLLFQGKDDLLDGTITSRQFNQQKSRLVPQATESLEALPLSEEARAYFTELIAFVTNRTI